MNEFISQHLAICTTAIASKSNSGRGRKSPSPAHPIGHKGEGRGEGNPTNTRNAKYTAYGIKKLRELILELAVRGKLVTQDPNDEPARTLLDKIYLQKTRLIDEGKLKPQKGLPEISEEEMPPHLPTGWELVRLGEIINVLNGRAYKKHEMLQEGTPLLRVGNLFTSNEWYYSDLELEPDKYIDNGDLIYAWSASFGPFIWQGGKAIYHYHIWKLDLYDPSCLDKQFLFYFFTSITEKIKASGNGIAMIHMTKERMEKLILEIPPLAEQHRIVAKVDELMALCDQLEQQQTDHLAAHQTLVQTLLDTLTQAADAAEFEQAWSRIADHFETLFTTESSIDQLKQTLLQLAVMGKLVPQDQNDEPISVLLERDAKQKEKTGKQGNLKNEKELSEILADEKPFQLPSNWRWVRLDDLSPEFQNGASSRGDKSGKEIIVLRLADIDNWKVSLRDTRTLTILEQSIAKYSLQKNDVLIIRVNGSADIVGRFVLCDESYGAIYCDHFIRLRFPREILVPGYLVLLGLSDLVRNRIKHLFISTAGQKTVNQKHIGSLVVSVPPIYEQHRIVAKVDELMALCDALKARIAAAQTTQLQLADAIVEQAVA
ncbi:restriction endonuclease subunit S [Methylomonas sp. SURF-2]|uniref:Restriction endonuclease subunit S n=1 Tax=Methylomonas subterranea TaxID=2952225 RepID=A0ABT1TB90_9GAMM|nr:restriction endonuclease subunit S [Methylomonas sp. SURF-2]MCQ8102731.1 restriction endonuclease subunit S [Methylomonas sp. SURF-2]